MTENKIFLVKDGKFDNMPKLKNFIELTPSKWTGIVNKAWCRVDWAKDKIECANQFEQEIFKELREMVK